MSIKLSVAVALIALTSAGTAAYYLARPAAANGLLRPGDPALVARGEAIYAERCASCHGADLQGEPDWRSPKSDGLMPAPPHDETGHTWHHPDDVLFALTKFGPASYVGGDYRSNMPAYDGILGDDDILAVLSYIKSRWPPALQKRHDQLNEQAQ